MNVVRKIVKATKKGFSKTVKAAHRAMHITKRAFRRYR